MYTNKAYKKLVEALIKKELASILESFRGFTLSNFQKIENIMDKYKYLKKLLPKLGQGSSRVVFGIGAGKVIKLAGSFALVDYVEKKGALLTPRDREAIESRLALSFKQGIAQNQEEIGIYTNPKIKPIVTEIFNFDKNYEWLVSEAVREVSKAEMEKYIKFPFYAFAFAVEKRSTKSLSQSAIAKNMINSMFKKDNLVQDIQKLSGVTLQTREEAEKYVLEVLNSEFFTAVFSAIDQGLQYGDAMRKEHWGKTNKGRIVIMDYGYTDTSKKLYGH